MRNEWKFWHWACRWQKWLPFPELVLILFYWVCMREGQRIRSPAKSSLSHFTLLLSPYSTHIQFRDDGTISVHGRAVALLSPAMNKALCLVKSFSFSKAHSMCHPFGNHPPPFPSPLGHSLPGLSGFSTVYFHPFPVCTHLAPVICASHSRARVAWRQIGERASFLSWSLEKCKCGLSTCHLS
jgi:hypothetical protein